MSVYVLGIITFVVVYALVEWIEKRIKKND
jgi:hypothetical protein